MKSYALFLTLLPGCFYFGEPKRPSECAANTDCQAGWVCVEKSCSEVCRVQADCPAERYCDLGGLCSARAEGPVPSIATVVGNAGDPGHVADGLVVAGRNLANAAFELAGGSGATDLVARVRSEESVELELPADVRSGEYTLVASNASGQGQAAVTLVLPELTGDELLNRVNENATGTFAVERLPGVVQAMIDGSCPRGYVRDVEETGFVLCKRGADEMVKVGDFWVDRYEAVVVNAGVYANGTCDGGACVGGVTEPTCFGNDDPPTYNFPSMFWSNGEHNESLYACSKAGVRPSSYVTWFMAQQVCILAGKHLITNAEWQAAVAGTPDPGAHDGTVDGLCNTQASHARVNSGGMSCRSYYGMQDGIGNLTEMTADWLGEVGYNGTADIWPDTDSSFGSDQYRHGGPSISAPYGMDGSLLTQDGDRLPVQWIRGGSYNVGADAGRYAASTRVGVASNNAATGFRCARGQ